ncbi:MAG: hypothetical protein ACR2KX_03975 [Chitinophagaceae bacterium]
MNIMNTMLLSCVKATELMEMKKNVPLGLLKTMQLHMHIAMCSGCRNYLKQSRLIDELIEKKFNAIAAVENTEELEALITTKLIQL